MVGTRRNLLSSNSSYGNGNINGNGKGDDFDKYQRVDLESGYGSINPVRPRQKFRDAVEQTMKNNRAIDMKKKLIENVDHTALEIYRKSDESVGAFETTPYEEQRLPICTAQMHKQQKGSRILRGTEQAPG